MKVLFITELYPSDASPQYCIFLEQQARALQQIGVQVDVLKLCSGAERNGLGESFVRNDITVTEFYYSATVVERYTAIAIKPKCVALRAFIKRGGYQVASFHFGNIMLFDEMAKLCKSIGVKTFRHYHGLNVWTDYYVKHRIYNLYLKWKKRCSIKCFDAVVGVSDHVCEVVQKNCSDIPVFTVYNGVNRELFYPSEKDNACYTVLCVANLIPIKGQIYLIRAMADILAAGRKARLVLIGTGSDMNSLREECVKLEILRNVVFLGAQAYSEVARYMRNADMFIMPSYYEAFGCVYVEAMASGTLTCGCWGGGAEEIITNGKDGVLVVPKDAKAIADVITWAMDHPDMVAEIALEGRKRAAAFSWENSAHMLADAYYCVLNKNAKGVVQ